MAYTDYMLISKYVLKEFIQDEYLTTQMLDLINTLDIPQSLAWLDILVNDVENDVCTLRDVFPMEHNTSMVKVVFICGPSRNCLKIGFLPAPSSYPSNAWFQIAREWLELYVSNDSNNQGSEYNYVLNHFKFNNFEVKIIG